MKPKSSITFTCLPGEADKALIGAAQAAVQCNERFGDNIDPAHATMCVRQFMRNVPSMKCRSCGWKDKRTGKCNFHGHDAQDGGTCPKFLHVFKVDDDMRLNERLVV